MSYQSSGAKKESELEKLHKATLRRKAYFESFAVGDRVEDTVGTRAKIGQICLAYPRFITVVFDEHSYKTTLSRADYLTGRFRIKKEEVSQMAQKLEAPSREELEAKLLSHQGNINKLAKDYGVAWSTARAWLIDRDLIEVSRSIASVKRDEEEAEAAGPMTPEEACPVKSPGEVILAYQEEIEFALLKITEKLNALEQKIDQLQTVEQVKFKDVADLAERMHRVWTDARRG